MDVRFKFLLDYFKTPNTMLFSVNVGGCCFMGHSSTKSFLPYNRHLGGCFADHMVISSHCLTVGIVVLVLEVGVVEG